MALCLHGELDVPAHVTVTGRYVGCGICCGHGKDELTLPPYDDPDVWLVQDAIGDIGFYPGGTNELAKRIVAALRAAQPTFKQVGITHPDNLVRVERGETAAFRKKPYKVEPYVEVYVKETK